MIVIVYPMLDGVGGIARYLHSFCRAAVSDEEIVVVTGGEVAREETIGRIRIVVRPLPTNRIGLIFWSLDVRRLLRRWAREGQVSLINLHIPPLIPGLLLPRVAKIVVTAHSNYLGMSGQLHRPRKFRSDWNPVSVWIKARLEHIIFARSDAIVTLTEQGRQEILAYGFAGPIAIIPNGVDLEAFSPGASTSKIYHVLFAGRIERYKGSRGMVDVCRKLVAKKPDIRICVVGGGDDFDYVTSSLRPFAANIELTGKLPFEGMQEKYRASMIYAGTSHYEGLPGTCLEAMAVGLPVVVWEYLFYKDLVIDNVNGRLIPPSNIDLFASAIIEILSSPERVLEMGKAARHRVETGYAWSTIASDLVRTFQDLDV